jgi:hypothetical protein
MMSLAEQDDDLFLDCVEGALLFAQADATGDPVAELQRILALGGSAYTVSEDGQHIVETVSREVEEIKSKALSVADGASQHLSEAWVRAYGRGPDGSDAWDHAIKAVEAVLQPKVEPNNKRATLGSMIAVLNNDTAAWRCIFPGKDDDNSVENLIATLRLIWPNPDRHGSGGRKPALNEARAVVTLAAAIVQVHREAMVVDRR